MPGKKQFTLVIVLGAIAGLIMLIESQRASPDLSSAEPMEIEPGAVSPRTAEKSGRFERAKEITTPDGFINVDSISVNELIGKKVILLDFWTYSCINCQRTMPYLNAWHEQYADQGLVIIGVHTPEFAFEKEYANVRRAVEKFGIEYPVVLDNDYSTWLAYRNRYWPRKYLIDIDGFIVYDHAGEGAYEETEREIREALEERRLVLGLGGAIATEIAKPENVEVVDPTGVLSPETYFGSLRNANFGSGTPKASGVQRFEEPAGIAPNTLYLVGEWEITEEFAENRSADAKILFFYGAQKVFLVAGAENPTRIRVLRDGEPLGESGAGSHVIIGEEGAFVTVNEEQLYRLVEDTEGPGVHLLEIIVEEPGLRAFAFTFG